ncbi:MAG TPA: TetR/AcrR family transcriptional regulator [Candidatus Dormibacteraeota bacterium]|nr:TetR/AcrR family transcriptional regulator [Candidatus Dormibacteraeota bacterium]
MTTKPANKRGRPKATPEAEPRTDELVQAAYRRIAEAGFEGLRTRDVADEVGVNIATLHYYFPTKEALIRGVVGHAMGRFRTAFAPGSKPGEQLAAQFQGIRRLARDEPELFVVMGELALRSGRDPAIAAIFRETIEAWHSTLVTLVRHAQNEGFVEKRLDPDTVASLVIATLNGLFMVPVANTASDRVDKALGQLESFLGLS